MSDSTRHWWQVISILWDTAGAVTENALSNQQWRKKQQLRENTYCRTRKEDSLQAKRNHRWVPDVCWNSNRQLLLIGNWCFPLVLFYVYIHMLPFQYIYWYIRKTEAQRFPSCKTFFHMIHWKGSIWITYDVLLTLTGMKEWPTFDTYQWVLGNWLQLCPPPPLHSHKHGTSLKSSDSYAPPQDSYWYYYRVP